MEDDPEADSPANPNAERPETLPMRPKPQRRGPLEEWELDDSLTPKERSKIKAQKSEYERERQYNILRNARILQALKIPDAAQDLMTMCKKAPGRMSKAANAKDLAITSGKEVEDLLRAESPTDSTGSEARPTRSNTNNNPTSHSTFLSLDTTSSASALEAAIQDLDEIIYAGQSNNTDTAASNDESLNVESPTTEAINVDLIDDEPLDLSNYGKHSAGAADPPTAQSCSSPPSPNRTEVNAGVSLVDAHPNVMQWADWMEPVVRSMEGMVDDEAWAGTLLKWLSFESLMGYPAGRVSPNHHFPTFTSTNSFFQSKKVLVASQSRPSAIGVWLKAGRQVEQMPDLTMVVDAFGLEWWIWWTQLLNGRLDGFPEPSLGVPPPKLEDVEEVMKGGANGVFLLLLSLAWWGLAARDQEEARVSAWKCAFEDFNTVLNFMYDHGCASTVKRPGDELESSRVKRSKYVFYKSVYSDF